VNKMDKTKLIQVTKENEGKRIDAFLAAFDETLTRNAVQRLIENKNIVVNRREIAKNYKLKEGDIIEITLPPPTPLEVAAEDIPLDIVYEDQYLLVVNKPKGMVVHPAAGNLKGTLVNALLAHCKDLSGINGVIRPGIVHRIDKDTSGLLMVAKTDAAHLGLAAQIKDHSFLREYEAVLCGRIKEESFTVDKPIGRHKKDRKKMAVCEDGRNAVTHFEVIKVYDKFTHVRCRLETGRTHQIRVHAASIGHPVAGDSVYGKAHKDLNGQCLHAKKLGFVHPITHIKMEFDSELPDYFKNFLKKCGKVDI